MHKKGWLIHKGGAGWFKPGARGYTQSVFHAGRFSLDEAKACCAANDEITAHHKADVYGLRGYDLKSGAKPPARAALRGKEG